MKLVVLVLSGLALLLVQTVLLIPSQGSAGFRPDLLLLLTLYWGRVFGQGQGILATVLAGALLEFSSAAPLGATLLALAPVAVLGASEQQMLAHRTLGNILLALPATLLYYSVLALASQVVGWPVDWLGGILWTLAPGVLSNLVAGPLVYGGVYYAGSVLGAARTGPTLGRVQHLAL
ncbi:MAG: rod shape-determining protein MreD [Chloroflexi bacterium]|nr:rod shape-determining protein MreD [Chloroflexota bacterium]